jgi:5'-3' exoribonuclease 2
VKLSVVREYLFLEFKDLQLPFPFDFERIVDDFVFLCFFVGNDFLPHLPSLHIREGALDAILVIYKHLLPSLGDYLTRAGEIDFAKVDLVFSDIAKIEEESFKMKKQNEERYQQRLTQGDSNGRGGYRGGRGGSRGGSNFNPRYPNNNQPRPEHIKFDEPIKTSSPTQKPDQNSATQNKVEEDKESGKKPLEEFEEKQLKELADLKEQDLTEEELNKQAAERMKEMVKKMISEKQKEMADQYEDKIQFGTEGWKLRYYNQKFHITQDDLQEFM